MNNSYKIFFIFFVSLELIIIGFFGYTILHKNKRKKNVLGVTSVSPIRKENLIFPSNELKYFYEPEPNNIEEDSAKWHDYKVTYTINSDALNERFDYTIEKPSNVFRIITLGDSLTFGDHINTKDNWPERLEDMLNQQLKCKNIQKFEVINLGERGYDIAYIVHRYKIRGIKYHPDLILWLESGTGFYRFREESTEMIYRCEATMSADFKKSLQEDDNPKNDNVCWDYWETEIMKRNKGKTGVDKLTVFWNEFYQDKDTTPFIYMLFSYSKNEYIATAKELVSNRLNTTLYTSLTSFYEKNGALPDGHPNEEGHRIIANDVFQYLLKNNNIPCEVSQ